MRLHAEAGAAEGALAGPPPSSTTQALLRAARPLLENVDALRRSAPPKDPRALRARLLQALQAFDHRAGAAGVEGRQRQVGSYLLCTLLDEAVARTAWGAACHWPRDGLLVTRHGEGFGGERFFALARHACADPPRHAPLIELMAVMLGLGFEGRHALEPDGPRQLEAWRRRLVQAGARASPCEVDASFARVPAGEPSRASSMRQSRERRRRAWRRAAIVAAWVLVLLALDRWIASRMQARADHAIGLLASLRLPPPAAAQASAGPPATSRTRLAEVLRPEIDAGWVDVEESAGRSRVTLVGDRLYEPGEARVRPDHREVLARIAAALDQVPGRIVVAGHTDDRPVRPGAGWASNQALSLARAREVVLLLSPALRRPGRVRAEGWADAHPRASNATEAGRARNRRVEISLVEEGADDAAAPRP